MKILMSGGGTGKHIYPAITIANKFREMHPEAEIVFVGTSNSIESKIVPEHGYDIKYITVKSFTRKLDSENFRRFFLLLKGLNEARVILKRFKPDIVIGTGGYVSGPLLLLSSMTSATTVIHEQNSIPGITNKILSLTAKKVFTSFDNVYDKFPSFFQKKIKLTGSPIRKEFLLCDKSSSRKKLHIPTNKKMVLCFGGSSGFNKINAVMKDVIKDMVEKDLAFIYATGTTFFDEFMSEIANTELKYYQKIVPYIDDMPNALCASDLVISSAGAISLAEITALGKPSIIIPKSDTKGNYQECNAKSIEDRAAGFCILENNLTSQKLSTTLFGILEDEVTLVKMHLNSKNIGRPDSVSIIYNEIMKTFILSRKNITISDNEEIHKFKSIKIKKSN